jgi:hypothetical protein
MRIEDLKTGSDIWSEWAPSGTGTACWDSPPYLAGRGTVERRDRPLGLAWARLRPLGLAWRGGVVK